MYEALKVANYFLSKASGKLTPMKVLKLVYFAHGWTLSIKDEPLIKEPVEAWRWGPVVRSVFNANKHHKIDFIREYNPKQAKEIEGDYKAILDRVYDLYGSKSGLDLSALTHMEGNPWHEIYVVQKKDWGSAIIPNNLIKYYFKNALVRNTVTTE